ncbi:MAG: hypothetical protein H6772_02530 [Pseudomonadales bacterium]|nr:hypothetical protein [Pseudomonadales bacterium]
MSRLPTVGGDENNWGIVLNDFLQVAHNADGSPKNAALTTHEALNDTAHNLTDKVDKSTSIIEVSSTYEVQASDRAKTIEANGTFTITFPDGLATGFQVVIVNVGSGTITLSAATSLQSAGGATTITSQYSGAVVYHRGTNIWLAMGNLS